MLEMKLKLIKNKKLNMKFIMKTLSAVLQMRWIDLLTYYYQYECIKNKDITWKNAII